MKVAGQSNNLAEPTELKFSLNTLPHPGFKVCDGENYKNYAKLNFIKKIRVTYQTTRPDEYIANKLVNIFFA